MVKDFDLNLKVETSSSEGKESRYKSIIYCTPGCLTGELCGSSECGLTKSCTNTYLCG
mgnify:FL=1